MTDDDPFFGEPEAPTDLLWVPEEERRGEGPALVEVRHEWEHAFVKRPGGKRGCETCGAAKADLCHHGSPGSFNAFGSGANKFRYQAIKQAWELRLIALLRQAGLKRPLGRVSVEGRLGFPDRRKRDQGNFRILLEKALGDALQKGGWLTNDDWDHYEFGGLQKEYTPGLAWTELLVYASWPEEETPDLPADPPGQGALL